MINAKIATYRRGIIKLNELIKAEQGECDHDFVQTDSRDIWDAYAFSHCHVTSTCRKCGSMRSETK